MKDAALIEDMCLMSAPAAKKPSRAEVTTQTPGLSRRQVTTCVGAVMVPPIGAAQAIVRPPLTDSVWPVTKLAPSEARKATAGPMSSGGPSPRIGIRGG